MNRTLTWTRTIMAVAGAALFVSVLALLAGVGKATVSAQTPTAEPQTNRTVSVTGTGSVRAEPDRAIVVLGVQTSAETASEALENNNTQMQALLTALRDAGIASADITTRTVQLFPRYSDRPAPDAQQDTPVNQVVGYTATNSVEVRFDDLDNLGELLDQAVEAGGNQIESISFDVADPSTQLEQAREAAFEDARRKASQLADLAGAELGEVVSIVETSGFPVPVAETAARAFDQAGSAVPISPGSQTLQLSVQVTWALE